MTKLKPVQISNYMSKPDINHTSIWSRAKSLVRLEAAIRKIVPEPLNQNFGLANIRNQQVTLYTESSAWSYKLRLHSSAITKFLKKKGIIVNQVKVIVIPITPDAPLKTLAKPKMTAETKRILAAAKQSVQNPEIQKTLDKLLNIKEQ